MRETKIGIKIFAQIKTEKIFLRSFYFFWFDYSIRREKLTVFHIDLRIPQLIPITFKRSINFNFIYKYLSFFDLNFNRFQKRY